MKAKSLFVYPRYPQNLANLYHLAYNLWATWNYDAINLFYRIDANLFRACNHNPVRFLITLPKEKLDALSKDRGFLFELGRVWDQFQNYLEGNHRGCEAQAAFGYDPKDTVAYFLLEFGVHESLPIYAGGLGILSGDFLKGSSDMGLPVVGVGLYYKYGYFTQRINMYGYQEEVFQPYEKHLLPLRRLRTETGEPRSVSIRILEREVKAGIWEMQVGRSRAILLDTDLPENPPDLRAITDELYVADPHRRIQQEIVLGIGGIKALADLGIKPAIYHLNEGHSAFLIIGRLRELMREQGLSFQEARAYIRASTVFTTHTPVIAGNEHFPTGLVRQYLEPEAQELGIRMPPREHRQVVMRERREPEPSASEKRR